MFKKNPLDPLSWRTETHRFDLPGEGEDIRLGVHTTTEERAIAYAVHKASQEGDLDDDEPNCGIVLMLDTSGLQPLPEGDAPSIAKYEDIVIDQMRYEGINRILKHGTKQELADAVIQLANMDIEGYDPEDVPTTWWDAYTKETGLSYDPWRILPILEEIARKSPTKLYKILKQALKNTGSFPLELWADTISQWRYMVPVGTMRLLAVIAVHPIELRLYNEDSVGKGKPNRPTRMSLDCLQPETVVLWDAGSKQLRLAFMKSAKIEYHGTDISRARQAFPELADVIRCPWKVGQPEW
jgi:hypothetical protein